MKNGTKTYLHQRKGFSRAKAENKMDEMIMIIIVMIIIIILQ